MARPTYKAVNCVVVGDRGVGKTCLLISRDTGSFPEEYIPTVYDNTSTEFNLGEQRGLLSLWDSSDTEEFERVLHPLRYRDKQIVIICFSLVNPTSFERVKEKWVPEVRKYAYNLSIILVGMKLDLREDMDTLDSLIRKNKRPITEDQGRRLASEIGAVRYIECSSLAQVNVKKIFDEVIRITVDFMTPSPKKKECILS